MFNSHKNCEALQDQTTYFCIYPLLSVSKNIWFSFKFPPKCFGHDYKDYNQWKFATTNAKNPYLYRVCF